MQWHEFVFSTKPKARLLRHSVFWAACWLYFVVCHLLFQQLIREPSPKGVRAYYVDVGSNLMLKTFLLLLISAIACYAFNYFILPQLLKGKRLKPVTGVLVLCAVLYGIGYVMYWNVFPFIDALFGLFKPAKIPARFWPAVSLGLLDPLKIVAAAGIIKYIKYWWQKQQESKKLEQEKIDAELRLLKAQMQPEFLFNALNNIYEHSLSASPRAPEMLLKLSDLLSYMLYECDEPLVPLEKEIEMMKDYIALEKIRLNDAVEMELSVRGDMEGKMIAPFLLLPFIENSFKHSSTHEQTWINMDIGVDGDSFYMKLANGMRAETNSVQIVSENSLANVQKRLSLMYPQKHDLKISCEREMLIVLLKIQLVYTPPTETKEDVKSLVTKPAIAQPNLYAAQ